jgi:hypothetical protein
LSPGKVLGEEQQISVSFGSSMRGKIEGVQELQEFRSYRIKPELTIRILSFSSAQELSGCDSPAELL